MRCALVLLLLVLATGVCLGQETEPTTSPATLPAVTTQPTSRPGPDHSLPEKTWDSLCTALKNGDLAAFRAGFYNRNELATLFIEAYSDATVSSFELALAAQTLGKEGKQLSDSLSGVYNSLIKMADDHKTVGNGDLIRWIHEEKTAKGTTQEVIYFRHFRGEWLVDTVETYMLDTDAGRENAERYIDNLPKITTSVRKVTDEVRSGKITTIDEIRKRLVETNKPQDPPSPEKN